MALVIRDSSGWATHNVERAANGVDMIIINRSTGLVEGRIENGAMGGQSIKFGDSKVCLA